MSEHKLIATALVPDPLSDSDDGPWFSARDWARLRQLPSGAKLYAADTPPLGYGAVWDAARQAIIDTEGAAESDALSAEQMVVLLQELAGNHNGLAEQVDVLYAMAVQMKRALEAVRDELLERGEPDSDGRRVVAVGQGAWQQLADAIDLPVTTVFD